jgi:hypothetical protein
MATRRKQGERDAEGSTRKLIFSYILAQPEGIEEQKIRDKLAEEANVREPRGIKEHLKKLKADKVIKLRKGKWNQNVWALNTDFEKPEDFYDAIVVILSEVNLEKILKETEFLGIHHFLRMNESQISETFLRALGITIKNKEVEEKLIYMLRVSPVAFSKFITGVLPTCQSMDKKLEEHSIGILDSGKEMKEKAIRILDSSYIASIEREFADVFLKTDESQRKGDCVELKIKTLEMHFWHDLWAVFLFDSDPKGFDFEKLIRIFKMKAKRNNSGVCSCEYELTQKFTVSHYQGYQNNHASVSIHRP